MNIQKLIKDRLPTKKEQLDKDDPDNYGACYAIAGWNHAIESVESLLPEIEKAIVGEIENELRLYGFGDVLEQIKRTKENNQKELEKADSLLTKEPLEDNK